MTEFECPWIYETGAYCGICSSCLDLQQADPRYGTPSDLDLPEEMR